MNKKNICGWAILRPKNGLLLKNIVSGISVERVEFHDAQAEEGARRSINWDLDENLSDAEKRRLVPGREESGTWTSQFWVSSNVNSVR